MLAALEDGPPLVDTTQMRRNLSLCGYYRAVTGYGEYTMCRVTIDWMSIEDGGRVRNGPGPVWRGGVFLSLPSPAEVVVSGGIWSE